MAMSTYVGRRCIGLLQRTFSIFHGHSRNISSLIVESDVEDVVEYPPIKPRWPPGSWGSLNEKESWKQWEKKVEFETQSMSASERLEKVSLDIEFSWQFPVVQNYPNALLYQQDVTKTCLLSGMPDYYHSLEEEAIACLPAVRAKVEQGLLLEKDVLDRSHIKCELSSKGMLQNQYIRLQLIDCLLASLSTDYPHLRTCQIGENVKVKAFWDRHGFPVRSHIFNSDVTEEKLLLSKTKKMDSRFHTEFDCCVQLRSDLPLKQFVDPSSPLCCEIPYPNFKYWPKDLIQSRKKGKFSCLPGHFLGDPCEFGLVAIDCPSKINFYKNKYGNEISEQLQTGMGLTSLFGWTVAQAYSLGFNTYTELTYPLSNQLILTDGQQYSFFAYQLNTLELWKDDDANALKNLCWHQENLKLFEDIQNGQFIGFNEDVLKQIIKFFINRPSERDVPLRPYLPPESKEGFPYIEFSSSV